MNCTELQHLWDRYRDRDTTLAPQQRSAFEQHLRACPQCAALYHAETDWLSRLPQAPAPLGDAAAFTQQVLARWDAGVQEPASPPAVIGRIGLGVSALAAGLALAAAVALAAWVTMTPVAPPSSATPTLAQQGTAAVSSLLASLDEQADVSHGLIGEIEASASRWNLASLIGQVNVPLPDPADWFDAEPDADNPEG